MPKDVLDQLGSLTLEKDHFLVNINTYSKLAPEVWSDYVSDMLSGAPLRACAELCGCRSRRPGSCACACAR